MDFIWSIQQSMKRHKTIKETQVKKHEHMWWKITHDRATERSTKWSSKLTEVMAKYCYIIYWQLHVNHGQLKKFFVSTRRVPVNWIMEMGLGDESPNNTDECRSNARSHWNNKSDRCNATKKRLREHLQGFPQSWAGPTSQVWVSLSYIVTMATRSCEIVGSGGARHCGW